MGWLWKGSASTSKQRELLRDFGADEIAATSIEYALIAVVLAGCLFIALPLMTLELAETIGAVTGWFQAILAG